MYNFIKYHLAKLIKIQKVENHRLKLLVDIRFFLRNFQVWPSNNQTIFSRLRFLFGLMYCSSVVWGVFGHFIILCLHKELRVFSLMISDVSVLLGGFAGYQFIPQFYIGQHRAKKLLVAIGDFTLYDKPPRIELEDAVMSAICRIYYIVVYSLAPPLLVVKLLEECPDDEDMICGLAFPAYVPGLMSPIGRKILVFLQITSLFNYTLYGFGCLWFFLQLSNAIVLYLKHLQHLLLDLAFVEDWGLRRRNAIKAVKYHQRILVLYQEFFDLCKGIFVIYAVWIPVIMGLMTYTLTVEFHVQFFAVYVLWATALVITCIFGQNMITESERINDIVYMSLPSDGDIATSKIMNFMLMYTQKPLFVPAGSLTYCGYSLLLTVAQTTYSYLTLLNTTNSN